MSPPFTKRMAMEAWRAATGGRMVDVVADIGAGRGELTRALTAVGRSVLMVDYSPPDSVPDGTRFVQADLNDPWPIDDGSVDFAFSLEVIEHLENPRHFFREFKRILRPGGFGFVSTPNNHALSSKLTFLFRDQHRLFQDPSYPAHITPLLRSDMLRMLAETGLEFRRWIYSNEDTLPLLHWRIALPGRAFSLSLGILFARAVNCAQRKNPAAHCL